MGNQAPLTYGKGVNSMKDTQFPRMMKKGVFRGRTFQTNAEYQAALSAVRKDPNGPPKRKSPTKRVAKGTYRIEVHTESMHLVVEGDITKRDVQDTLLDAIARLPVNR